jgi:hypothetical protein
MNNPTPKNNSDRKLASRQFQQALDHLHQLTVIEAHELRSRQGQNHLNRMDWEEVGEELAAMIELGEDF